jgi:Thiamine pyrophosphate-requiring enzymes [acetolactate synthase, pyruvate dehydrogenase (cytochrome), glyoxylate carboligase, phosphonopyruvate decarboxylase]
VQTVRDAAFDVMRQQGITTIFANPGSTEISLLTDLPDDLRFVLGLHEGSVVGMATGYALAHGNPPLVLLHTTAGLGNAVGALATARVNRAPLVVVVGQQDRRHLAQQPFLAGRLERLAGDYPVSVETPLRPQDVPGAIGRAAHAARLERGPALVIVPSGDWEETAEDIPVAAPAALHEAVDADPALVDLIAGLIADAQQPALVVGAGADDERVWAALVRLAESLGCPVWQEAFGARSGFPQDHPQFAGHLPADRPRLRDVLFAHDLVLVVGAPAFRQYPFKEGALTGPDTRIAVMTDDPVEARTSSAEVAVVTPLPAFCERLADRVIARPDAICQVPDRRESPAPPAPGEPLRAAHVLAALAERLPANVILVEETPSSRPDLHALMPTRRPMGFVSAAMGGLGFAVPAAVGLRMGGHRPVVAVVGDGASLYSVQALWTAAHYDVGVLIIVLANGRYAVMDRLADAHGGKPPWPAFEEVSLSALAQGFGCPARRIEALEALLVELDEVVPSLADRHEPLVLEVAVRTEETFQP